MKTIYSNKIIDAGKDVGAFGSEMIILFGDNAPDTLKDYCYSIPTAQTADTIKPGQYFCLGDEKFKILQVGEIAEKNLNGLGHLTVNFTGEGGENLPGAIVVENKIHAPIKVGTVIKITEE